jgi:uncharacterized membrane protein YedE/YeeE
MTLTASASLLLALAVGFAFGWLLHRGKVTDADVVGNQFRLLDFTVLKVMFTAIVVGGIGVLVLVHSGYAHYAIKDANLLGVALGAALFGAGMVLYGYCPGTGLAALATGSVHALIGAFGMVAGAIFYALSFDWTKAHILGVWAFGKVRLPEITGIPDTLWFAVLAVGALTLFYRIEHGTAPRP